MWFFKRQISYFLPLFGILHNELLMLLPKLVLYELFKKLFNFLRYQGDEFF